MKGLPWAQVRSDFTADPKLKRLERSLAHRDYLAAVGAYMVILADAWRVGSRDEGLSALDMLLDSDLLLALQAAELLDAEGRIPERAYGQRIAGVLRDASRRSGERSVLASLGGKARSSSASRDGEGRFQPSSQPSAGARLDPAVIQPSSSQDLDIDRDSVRSPVGGSRGEGPFLTKTQLEQWRTFDAESDRNGSRHLWEAVKTAWLGRGLRHPPTEKQRAILWEVLDARPVSLIAWIREAPPEARTSRDVLGFVLGRWHEVQG